MPKMDNFLDENHWDSPTLTLLNVLNVLNMPNDASLACWALFIFILFLDASLYEGVSVRRMDGRMDGPSVTCFFKCQKWTIFFMKIIGAVQL